MLTCTISTQNGEGPDPVFFDDFSSPFQRPQWTGVDFPATSFYPCTTCVFPSLVCGSFQKKCWRAQFYLKMAKALTLFLFVDLSSPFQRSRWTGVDFPATSFNPWTTCVFPSLVFESFLKKCWLAQFYLKVAKALTRFFVGDLPSPFQRPRLDRGRFSSPFLLSVDNMCLSFFS